MSIARLLVKVSPIEKRMIGRSELWGIRRHLTDEGGGSRLVTPVCPNIERTIHLHDCRAVWAGEGRRMERGRYIGAKSGRRRSRVTFHHITLQCYHYTTFHRITLQCNHFTTFHHIGVHCNTMPLYWSTSHYIGAKSWGGRRQSHITGIWGRRDKNMGGGSITGIWGMRQIWWEWYDGSLWCGWKDWERDPYWIYRKHFLFHVMAFLF